MADPYSTEVLKLAAEIPHLGRLTKPDASARKVSRICGSAIDVDLVVEDGRIADVGLEVNACALGQAAASVFARDAIGADLVEVAGARDALKAMLKTGGPPPEGRFAGLAALEGARDYPARHGSIMLAFEAAAAALEDAAERPRA
ncbi:iron-sulfur cluster assembly scaffold protein [Marinicauda salina]|uniref:Iron-sulfur cluster assembly scaffold protein n=1 Tax=Marinicauda salina TaxID=2135793 RepID=A0A2U2BQQ0_9PROT|nr:iron-sulfur cluster assembly scaffold protein [Marinicauda salina]PWE16331.1 iron-sulfur cluster assembly scaffold protein [Marinicauda salina]